MKEEAENLQILEGTDESYTLSTNNQVVIHCSGEKEDLVSVAVDDVVIDASNYTVEKGSTKLTLKAEYLETLTAGEHKVTLNYAQGKYAENSIDITLTVLAGDSSDSNDSSDNSDSNDSSDSSDSSDAGNIGNTDNSAEADKDDEADVTDDAQNVVTTGTATPGTGDNNNIGLWIILCMSACMVIAGILRKKNYK